MIDIEKIRKVMLFAELQEDYYHQALLYKIFPEKGKVPKWEEFLKEKAPHLEIKRPRTSLKEDCYIWYLKCHDNEDNQKVIDGLNAINDEAFEAIWAFATESEDF